MSPATYEVRRRGAPRGKRIKVMFRWAVNALVGHTDKNGHQHAEMFMHLPSPQEYPDYYQFIRHPISFAEIEERLDQKEYINTYALVSDVRLMLDNAQFYNEEHSLVWNDAQALRTYLDGAVIPAFLAEGFTLDPNDHRQAALPPGTPGYVPPPGGIAASTPPIRSQPPERTPIPLVQPPRAPVPEPPRAPPVPGVPLERLVRALDAKVWPPHPALLRSTPDTDAHEPPAPPFASVEVSLLPPSGPPLAHMSAALTAPRVAFTLPRGIAGAAVRLIPHDGMPDVHATLDRAPLAGTWDDGVFSAHIAPGVGASALEARWSQPTGAGDVGVYIRR